MTCVIVATMIAKSLLNGPPFCLAIFPNLHNFDVKNISKFNMFVFIGPNCVKPLPLFDNILTIPRAPL